MRTILCALIFTFVCTAWSADEPASFPTVDAATAHYLTAGGGLTIEPDSAAIARATYFPQTKRRVMLIYFTSNPATPYLFEGVPPDVWQAFTDAESKGKFYHAMIKGRYTFALSP